MYFCGKTIHPAIRKLQKRRRNNKKKKNIIHYKTKEWNRIIGNDWFNTKHNDFRINCFLGVSNKSGFCILYSFFFVSIFVVLFLFVVVEWVLNLSLTYSLCCRNQQKRKKLPIYSSTISLIMSCVYIPFTTSGWGVFWKQLRMVTHYDLNGANIFAYFHFNGNFMP